MEKVFTLFTLQLLTFLGWRRASDRVRDRERIALENILSSPLLFHVYEFLMILFIKAVKIISFPTRKPFKACRPQIQKINIFVFLFFKKKFRAKVLICCFRASDPQNDAVANIRP